MPDVDMLVGQVVPAVGAAVSAYGTAVLTRAETEAAGATVRLGQRLLHRLLRRGPDPAALERAVTDLAAAEGDQDAVAALRLRVRQALHACPELAAELAGLLPAPAAASGGVRVGGDVSGIVSTGAGATNTVDNRRQR
ncbi:hypothetical protein ACFV3R_07250 [Streptomyces sp. NPDC059740]|uniref:hypothetical protein n=1 Tax=Streptomyces sp. NPDC059740 TaxID=3346926 RepID=UPI00366341B7